MATIAKLVVDLSMNDTMTSTLERSRQNLDSWGASARKWGGLLTATVTAPIVAAGTAMVGWAASTENAIGKTEQVFGDSANAVLAWSETTDRAMGIAQNDALQMVSTYGALYNQMGQTTDQSAAMSQEMLSLSADMAAFNDVSQSRASEAIMAGLTGEYESLKRMGIFLNEAMVAEEALRIAQAEGRSEITEADKVLARHNLILEQAEQQTGQFARESNSLNGKLSIARARFRNLGAELGAKLIPYVSKMLDYFEQLLDWFDDLNPTMQKTILIVGMLAAALGPVLIVIGMMLPAIGALAAVLAFLLSPVGLIVIAIAALVAGLIYAYTEFEAFREVVNTAATSIVAGFQAIVDGIQALKDAFDEGGWSAVWQTIVDAFFAIDWGAIGQFLLNVGAAALGALRDGLVAAWPTVRDWLAGLPGLAWDAVSWLGGILWDKGTELLSGLLEGIDDKWEDIKTWFGDNITKSTITSAIGAAGDWLEDTGIAIMDGLIAGINDIWTNNVKPGLEGLQGRVVGLLKAPYTWLLDTGKQIIQGLQAGLLSAWTEVESWFQGIIDWIDEKVTWITDKITAIGELLGISGGTGEDDDGGNWTDNPLYDPDNIPGKGISPITIDTSVFENLELLKTRMAEVKASFDANIVPVGAGFGKAGEWPVVPLAALASIKGGFDSTLPAIASLTQSNFDRAKTAATSSADTMRSNVVKSIGDMADNAINNTTRMNLLASIQAALMQARFSTAMMDMNTTAATQMSILNTIIQGGMSRAANTVAGMAGRFYGAGQDAMTGLIGGVQSRMGALQAAVNQIIAIFAQIPALGNSPWPMMIDASQDAMDGLVVGIDNRKGKLNHAIGDVVNAFAGADPTLNGDIRGAGHGLGGQVVQIFYSVTPDELRKLIADAEAGGTFARQFGGEIAMREGAV